MTEDSGVSRSLLLLAAGATLGVGAYVAAEKLLLKRGMPAAQPLLKPQHVAGADALVDGEILARVEALYGADGLKRLRESFVVVIGLGGVGSHCAMALMRSGVGRVRLVDFDQVTVSSLNRHACATREDVGKGKCDVLKDFFARVMPSTHVEAIKEVFNEQTAAALLSGNPDFVVDAIDNRVTKAHLIKCCVDQQLPVISCMGAGARIDPSRVQIGLLTQTRNDPLCKGNLEMVLLKQQEQLTTFIPFLCSVDSFSPYF